MFQTGNVPGGTYAKFMDSFFPGMVLDTRYSDKESFTNADSVTIGFGIGVVLAVAAAISKMARLPRLNQVVLSASGALGASNSTVVTVDGHATTATVYAVGVADTMEAIAAKVRLLTGVVSCTVLNNTFIITTNDTDVVASAVTTGGSGVTWSAGTSISVDSVKGITVYVPKQNTLPTPSTPSASIAYESGDGMTTMKRGVVAGVIDPLLDLATIGVNDAAYIVTAHTASRGTITNVATGNLLVGKFRLDLDERNQYLTLAVAPIEVVI